MFTKRNLLFQKPHQIVKSEKFETFRVSKLLIWRQKWVARIRLSPENGCVILNKILSIRRDQSKFSKSLHWLGVKEKAIIE